MIFRFGPVLIPFYKLLPKTEHSILVPICPFPKKNILRASPRLVFFSKKIKYEALILYVHVFGDICYDL